MAKAKTKRQGKKQTPVREFTLAAVIVGILVGVVATAANVYLGLYVGMTVSGSIPAAVIGLAVFRGLLRRNSIGESNIVQTMASAGESLAAGVIFTVPALVLVGAWNDFKFWPTTLIAMLGGFLGVIFMIPLRKALIIEEKNLTYPEGVACAAVLTEGSSEKGSGIKLILNGLILGAVMKIATGGMKIFHGSVEAAWRIKERVFFAGTDVSPALLAVGYIVNFNVAALVMIGGLIGWGVGIPLMGITPDLMMKEPIDIAWTLWSTKVRYLGVGAMVAGGAWSIFSVRSGIASGLKEMKSGYQKGTKKGSSSSVDMDLTTLMVFFVLCVVGMLGIYQYLIGDAAITVLTTLIMIIASFIFVAVSSYIVGLVGSSNNPVSGMTISALLGTAALFLVLGWKGESAILATLGVAAVVCCATCTAGDCSQDLKTGYLVGSTPKYQQYAQLIGVAIPAFVIAPVLSLLHSTYGIGTGLKAPQATLFASITNGLFGTGSLPTNLVILGFFLGVAIIIADQILEKRKATFRLHVMPVAIGIYLPVTMAVPILVGGLIRMVTDRKQKNSKRKSSGDSGPGVLFCSGLIAGEAIMGVAIALLLYLGKDLAVGGIPSHVVEALSLLAMAGLSVLLYRIALKKT